MTEQLLAPFPWFGGKRKVAADVWARLGEPKQYIEPFCGSAAILLAAPSVASLEVVGDMNGFIANFWRAVKHQPAAVAEWAAEHAHLRIAICGHAGDYDLPGWDAVAWKRDRLTYGSAKTTDAECIWYSPACLKPERRGQIGMFDTEAP